LTAQNSSDAQWFQPSRKVNGTHLALQKGEFMMKTGQYQRCISAVHWLETSGALALGAMLALVSDAVMHQSPPSLSLVNSEVSWALTGSLEIRKERRSLIRRLYFSNMLLPKRR
jgi:hypothetical protein